MRGLINSSQLTAVHDISDGGLIVAVIEMALPSSFGASFQKMDFAQMFGEDQSRYVITCSADNAKKILASGNALQIGIVTANPTLKIDGSVAISMAELREAHENWFPKFMKG